MDTATGVTLAVADGSMNVPTLAAFAVAGSAILTPLINAWMRRMEKRADWKRQDEVARRVEETSQDQKRIRKSLHAVLDEVQGATSTRENISEQLSEIKAQGTEIHGLVNGHLSASMESELDSKRIQLIQMQEIVALKGGNPSRETLDAITLLKSQIEELSAQVNDRRENAKQTAVRGEG